MADTRERRTLERDTTRAEESRSRADNIAKYGQLGGSLLNFKNDLGKASAAIGPYIVKAFIGAEAAIVASIYAFAAAASPSAASTFNASLDGIVRPDRSYLRAGVE